MQGVAARLCTREVQGVALISRRLDELGQGDRIRLVGDELAKIALEREEQGEVVPGGPSVATVFERLPYRVGETMLVCAPTFHAWGLVNFAMGNLFANTIVLQRRFDPERVLKTIEERRVQVMAVVPVMLNRILALDPAVIVPGHGANFLAGSSAQMRNSIACPRVWICSCSKLSGSPAAMRSCHSTRSTSCVSSLTGCSTWRRVFISRK